MIKEKFNLKIFLGKFDKFDYLTVLFFLVGFGFSVLDFNILEKSQVYISGLSKVSFAICYVIMFLYLLMTTRLFIKNGPGMRLKKESRNNILQFVKLLLLGYYMGFVVNVSNAFILVLFSRFL